MRVSWAFVSICAITMQGAIDASDVHRLSPLAPLMRGVNGQHVLSHDGPNEASLMITHQFAIPATEMLRYDWIYLPGLFWQGLTRCPHQSDPIRTILYHGGVWRQIQPWAILYHLSCKGRVFCVPCSSCKHHDQVR